MNWQDRFRELLPLYGHRNWIVIGDAAMPALSGSRMEVIATGEPMAAVLEFTMAEIAAAPHVRAVPRLDWEIDFLDQPAHVAEREQVLALVGPDAERVLHSKLLARLDEVASVYQVAMFKTTCTAPYTSVFIELDCGYWSPTEDEALHDRMPIL